MKDVSLLLEAFVKKQKSVNQRTIAEIYKTAREQHKMVHNTCAGSRTAEIRDKCFKCAKVDLFVELNRLIISSYGEEEITVKIYNKVVVS